MLLDPDSIAFPLRILIQEIQINADPQHCLQVYKHIHTSLSQKSHSMQGKLWGAFRKKGYCIYLKDYFDMEEYSNIICDEERILGICRIAARTKIVLKPA
jgi:hypothetical protein